MTQLLKGELDGTLPLVQRRAQVLELDEFMAGYAMTALGSVLLHRDCSEEDGARWLADYRTTLGRGLVGELSPDYLPLHELGWAALRRGDLLAAEGFANRLDGHAATSDRKPFPEVLIKPVLIVSSASILSEQSGDQAKRFAQPQCRCWTTRPTPRRPPLLRSLAEHDPMPMVRSWLGPRV